MKPIGIIANPSSGKDIRRLVAHGSVFDNNEKVNIVRRLLAAMDCLGVEKVYIMPESYQIGPRAKDELDLSLEASFLDMEVNGDQDDSTRAAGIMAELGVACIITLGGDGTNRVVAKACGDAPLIPISTGTNNVFPQMVEGTLAGMAASAIASGAVSVQGTSRRVPRLEIHRGEELVDIALVDLVVADDGFTGSRAIWEVSSLREIFLTRAQPANIGFSSIGGQLCPLPPNSGKALYLKVGPKGCLVRAPIAPGLLCSLPVADHRVFESGEDIPLSNTPCMIALDGEREMNVQAGDKLSIRLNPNGPVVLDIEKILEKAAEKGFFVVDGE